MLLVVEQPLLVVGERPVDQVGTPFERPAQRLGAGASARCGRGRPTAAPRARPSPGTRPGACTAGTRAGRRRTTPAPPTPSLPITPGTSRATASTTTSAAASPPGEHVRRPPTARRRTGGRRPAGRRLRTGRRSARSPRPRPAPRPRAGRTGGPAARQQEQRPRRLDRLDRGEDRLGRHHHPRAAAERRVVDGAVPVVGPVAQVVRHARRPGRAPRLAQQRRRQRALEVLREDREEVDAHRHRPSVEQAVGRVDHDAVAHVLDDEHHRHERRRSRARGGRARGSPRPPRRDRASRPARSMTEAPITSCTHTSPSGAPSSGSARHARAGRAPRRRRGRRRPERWTMWRPWCGRDASTVTSRSPTHHVVPTATRSSRLVVSVTITSPRSPCGRPMRPISRRPARRARSRRRPPLLRDLDADAHAVERRPAARARPGAPPGSRGRAGR